MTHANRTRALLLALAALAVLLTACAPYPYVAFQPHAEFPLGEMREGHAAVRLFFATDRELTGRVAARHVFGNGRSATLKCGWAEVSIPRDHGRGRLEQPLFGPPREPSRDVALLKTWVNPERERALSELRARVEASADRELLVFVHGYAVTFEDAARKLAQIAHDVRFNGVPILYSWPTRGSVDSYFIDPANAEWSSFYLTQLLDDLVRFSGARRIHLMAHSMGTRVLAKAVKDYLARRALQQLEALAAGAEPTLLATEIWLREGGGNGEREAHGGPTAPPPSEEDGIPFDEIIFAASDMDSDIFERDYAPYLATAGRRLTLYISNADWALGLASYLLGHERVGRAPLKRLDPKLLAEERVIVIDASAVDKGPVGHFYYGASPRILDDLKGVLRGEDADRRGLQREFRYRILGDSLR